MLSLFSFFKDKTHSKVNDIEVYYNEWTEKYMEGFGEIFQAKQGDDLDVFFQYYIDSMGIKPGMKILDAGCGIGGPAIHLAQKMDVSIEGITVSEVQVNIGQQKILNSELKGNVVIRKLDFHHLTNHFSSNSFDLIYFMESLSHSNCPQKVIEGVHSILKDEGVLYVKDLFRKTAYYTAEEAKIDKWIKHNNENFKLNIITKEDLLLLLRKQGFQLQFCKVMETDTNQNLGNAWVVKNNLMGSPTSWHPYLEWYEIKVKKTNLAH